MKKHVFVLILLAISAHYVPKAMLLYSGYCIENGRYLTIQEKFDIVVTKIINEENWRLPYTVNEFGGKVFPKGKRYRAGSYDQLEGTIRTFKYSGLEEFYAANPNCCELVESFDGHEMARVTVPFKERLCGRLNILVRVFYIYDYDRQTGNLPLYAERYFGLSNCGDVWTSGKVASLYLPWSVR